MKDFFTELMNNNIDERDTTVERESPKHFKKVRLKYIENMLTMSNEDFTAEVRKLPKATAYVLNAQDLDQTIEGYDVLYAEVIVKFHVGEKDNIITLEPKPVDC